MTVSPEPEPGDDHEAGAEHAHAHDRGSDHGHDHDGHSHAPSLAGATGDARRMRIRAFWLVLLLNLVFMAVEVVVGLTTGSLAVLGDAGHMLADVGAIALALAAERLSAARGGPAHTFGYKRAPTLGAFGNAVSMYAVCLVLIVEAINRFDAPGEIPGMPVLIVGAVGLAINIGSAWLLHRQGGGHSHNVRGALLHMLGDALGSVAVIVSAVVIQTTGWNAIDPLMTLLIALLIGAATWPLLRDATRTLLQVSPRGVDVSAMREVLVEPSAVTCVEDFHIWELDAGYLVVSARLHVDCHGWDAANGLLAELKHELAHRFGVTHTTLELTQETDHPDLKACCE